MVISARTQTVLFAPVATVSPDAKALIRLPLSIVPQYERRCVVTGAIVPATGKPLFRPNLWNSDEHDRFLHGLELFPRGPWKEVAKVVGTKTTRQTMTHAQKYRQKIQRHMTMKPKQPNEKGRRRKQGDCSEQRVEPHDEVTKKLDLETASLSFLSEGLAIPDPMCSPVETGHDIFDISFLEEEFEAILATFVLLDPLEANPCRISV